MTAASLSELSYGSPAHDAGGSAFPGELSYEGRGAAVGPDLASEDEAGMEIPDPNVDAEWKTILGEQRVLL